ncbi:hypothetical protein ABW21_db0208077 [Orbilia brochopaga]|nr:hypothetical protein ABW21_db0208077 [Drechslerella brochopaga]
MEVVNIPASNTEPNNLATGETVENVQEGSTILQGGSMVEESPGIRQADVQTAIVEEPLTTNMQPENSEGIALSGEQGGQLNQGQPLVMPPPSRLPPRMQDQGQGSPVPSWENPALLNNRIAYWQGVTVMDRPYFTTMNGILETSDNLMQDTLKKFTQDQDLANTDIYLDQMALLARQRAELLMRNEQLFLQRLRDLAAELKRKDETILAGTGNSDGSNEQQANANGMVSTASQTE